MKRPWIVFLAFLLTSWSQAAPKPANPEAGGVVLSPGEGEISPGDEITISFPVPMVTADKIDLADQKGPFQSEPKMDGVFMWKSETEGVFTVRRVVAGADHRLILVPGLTDAAGKKFEGRGWSADFTASQFTVSSDFDSREKLNAQPQISLATTYPVRLAEVPDHVYFQDRDSGRRFPVDVILWQEEKVPDELEVKDFRVSPRAALPVGHTYDLIVNGLQESASRQSLPYLKVIPAGSTMPLKIEWVGAFNHPLEEPSIRIKFSDNLDPADVTPEKIRIEPAVSDSKLLASDDEITITGNFDLAQRYRVTISPALTGERGYGLTGESSWGATFHSREPCIAFPASQIFLRAGKEFRFSFFQINTPPVTWKLAGIPLEKLGVVRSRIREFEQSAVDPLTGKAIIDPRTGFNKPVATELLIDAFKLPVIASGTTEAALGNSSVRRDIECAIPQGQPLNGAYLLEAGAGLDGKRIVGNRSIVCMSDYILTQKRTPTAVILRVSKMADARQVAGLTVRAVTNDNIELGRATTDANGMATFSRDALFPPKKPGAYFFVADTQGGPALQFVDAPIYYGATESSWPSRAAHSEIIIDRNLYRPGQIVKMKGMVRAIHGSELAIPETSDVHWKVLQSDGDRLAGEGSTTLSSDGGWEAEWTVPEKSKLGRFEIRCAIGKEECEGATSFSIEEYRVPLFSVTVDATPQVGPTATAQVSSVYFHGAPNAGARVRWKAVWTASPEMGQEGDDYRKRFNAFAEVGPRMDPNDELTKSITGETTLDGKGSAVLSCESPFKDNAAIARADVSWRAEVTSVDGQTITGGEHAAIFPYPARLGIKSTETFAQPRGVNVKVDAIDQDDEKISGTHVRIDLFHVTTKTAKEQIAPFVYRYRNVDQFTKIESREVRTPGDVTFATAVTGRYVAAATALDGKAVMVSDETTISGEELAEFPVENETSFTIQHESRPFVPGEKAALSIQAPFGGVAWVSVETDRILDTLLITVPGNSGRIDLPIKKEYAPNAMVSIYLVKPGGNHELPRERFATSAIDVRRPDWELHIQPHLESSTVKPGEIVRGQVSVTSENKPVPDADLALFAVDDAVLKLGDWQLPDILSGFYRRNPFAVRSYQSLEQFIEKIAPKSLTQKGFIVGGGGEDETANVTNVRKEFKTLAFWQGTLKTNPEGKATFDFVAPDNLTTYRIVAVGQTKTHQFGGDAGVTLQVSKPLLINSALPRFLRDGDEVELRASIQQNFSDSTEVTFRCVTDASCKLLGDSSVKKSVSRDTPTVFRFKARVADVALDPTKIRFTAVAQSNSEMSDAVEVTLPVEPPTIVRKESVAGTFNGPTFNAKNAMPAKWKQGRGKFDATVSTSPWLVKIAGIPVILEYPHGCFEQISTKLLGYSFLADLLAYLPDVQARETEYRRVLEHGMKQFGDSLLDDGMLPYWPGGTSPNPFVTCQAFWAVNESVHAGFEPPEGLREKLAGALKKIVNGEIEASTLEKCFALFVLTQYATEENLAAVSQDLYLRRNQANDEARALLAIALHRQNIMPRETEQLLKEIEPPAKERAFDPRTFTSTTRAEAIAALAFDTVAPKMWTPERKKIRRDRMLALMDSSASLSTQENLWLLLAFKSMVNAEGAPTLGSPQPAPVFSKNRCSAAWLDRQIHDDLSLTGLNKAAMTFLLTAKYISPEINTDRLDRGFRIERVVRNLSDQKRTGDASAPLKIGDQVLITYRVNTQKKQSYVALEDELPAGLEIVNPNLALIGKFFDLPMNDPSGRVLDLSYSELRDRAALLYFDDFEPGNGRYSVLARATAAGTFHWPAAQISPMYDSRFSGLSPSSVCVISGE